MSYSNCTLLKKLSLSHRLTCTFTEVIFCTNLPFTKYIENTLETLLNNRTKYEMK